MAHSHLSLNPTCTSFSRPTSNLLPLKFYGLQARAALVRCTSDDSSPSADVKTHRKNSSKLDIGTPIVVVEAPQLLKTAASIPCLRPNTNLIKPGDVGRIVSRKPKDVWAVRLSIGTFLIDGKYFKPLELDDD